VFATLREWGGGRGVGTLWLHPLLSPLPPFVLRPLYYMVRPEDAPAPAASERKLRKVRYTTRRQAGRRRQVNSSLLPLSGSDKGFEQCWPQWSTGPDSGGGEGGWAGGGEMTVGRQICTEIRHKLTLKHINDK
jgi:hypothetical protein